MAAEFFAPEEWHMYQMNPAPERKDLQEYISAYFRLHDDKFLAAFLHYYEETLNQNVLSYMRRYFMMEHFTPAGGSNRQKRPKPCLMWRKNV